MPTARSVRVALLVVVVVLAVPVAVDYGTTRGETGVAGATTTPAPAGATTTLDGRPGGANSPDDAGNLVAYTIDAHGPAQVAVLDRAAGRVVFQRQEYNVYHDVDPSTAGSTTLLYAASNVVGGDRCPESLSEPCMVNVIERVNYSTGGTERLFTRTVAYNGSSAPHDVDRLSADRYLVADIQFDRIFVLDASTDEVVWEWEVAEAYDRSTGGREDDWTHLNDVEVIEEDLYMVSLRNHDQVIFVHRERGLLENRTLGADGDHGVLYEAHNPDYIPEERGGPAVLVADSENNRVVEYQWEGDSWANGSWNRSWLWTDETMQWPRDADRLPGGTTLLVDTHGLRLLEVTPAGDVVWERTVPRGLYDAELLGTGDESADGDSTAAIRAGNTTDGTTTTDGAATTTGAGGDGNATPGADSGPGTDSALDAAKGAFLDALPPLVFHGFLFLLPPWVTPLAGALLLVDVVLVALWGVGEGVGALVRYRPAGGYLRHWSR